MYKLIYFNYIQNSEEGLNMKKKNRKRQQLDIMYKNSVKIKCQYCDIKDTCTHRNLKEKSEQMGIKTFCNLTPNRPKSFIKKNKKKLY